MKAMIQAAIMTFLIGGLITLASNSRQDFDTMLTTAVLFEVFHNRFGGKEGGAR